MIVNSNRILSNIIWKFAESILAQLVSLVVSIVLARLLLPSDYGEIAMVMVFITVANVFVADGIPTALIQKKDADQLDFSSVFYFNFILSLLIYVFLWISSDWIADFYHNDQLAPIIKVLGLRLIIAAINSVQHAYVARQLIFKKYFWSTLFGTLLSGVVGIWMALVGCGVWALVAQYMVNTTVDTIVLFLTVDWKPKLMFSLKRVKELFSFGWKILFESVSNTIAGQLRNFVIGKVYTSSDLAYYTKGQNFPSLIVTNITASIGSVLFPAMSNEQNEPDRVLSILRKSVRVSSFVVYPMLIGLAVVAKPFIGMLLTEKWMDTVPYMRVFCLTYMSTVAFVPRHQALNSLGRSDVFMIEHMASRVVGLVLLFAVYKISILAIVLSGIISTIVLSCIIAYTSKKYNGYNYRDQIGDIVPTLIGCAIMGVPVYLIQYMHFSNLITLLLQCFVGFLIYVGYAAMRKIEEFYICKEYLLLFLTKLRVKK